MDPNFQLLLDEIKSVKAAMNGVESRVGTVETSLGSRISAMDRSIANRFGRVEDAVLVFDDWRPSVDVSVEELRCEVSTLHKQEGAIEKMHEEMMELRKIVSHAALDAGPSAPVGILHQPGVGIASSSTGKPAASPFIGPHVELRHQGLESSTQSPVKGTIPTSAATL